MEGNLSGRRGGWVWLLGDKDEASWVGGEWPPSTRPIEFPRDSYLCR